METPELIVALDAAESYFAKRLYANVWANASNVDKIKALDWAATLISGAFSFDSNAWAYENGDEERTTPIWNVRIVAAVCEEAIYLLGRDPTTLPELLTLGLSQGSAGNASATFDKSFVAPLVCKASQTLVGDLGTFLDGSGDVRSTPFPL